MSDFFVIDTADDARLLIREWENAHGRRMVTVAPQYKDRGEWRLAHSGLVLSAAVARELAPVLLTMAARIEEVTPC